MKRFFRNEDGTATIEFAILFPAFLVLFISAAEASILMMRQVMLDRATDLAVRELRLGTWAPASADAIKERVCEETALIRDCESHLLIELSPISTESWAPLPATASCADVSGEIEPVVAFQDGANNELMMVRMCALVDPIFPTTGLGLKLQRHDAEHYALISTSAFVNEPSR